MGSCQEEVTENLIDSPPKFSLFFFASDSQIWVMVAFDLLTDHDKGAVRRRAGVGLNIEFSDSKL